MLFAWMAYRQYFPPLALAESGRPYSIAEFATEKDERASATGYSAPVAYPTQEPDLELGTHPRRKNFPRDLNYHDGDTDMEDETAVGGRSRVPMRDDTHKIPEEGLRQGVPGSFEADTEYRR